MDSFVYDLKETMKLHPEGKKILKKIKGKNSTHAFEMANHAK